MLIRCEEKTSPGLNYLLKENTRAILSNLTKMTQSWSLELRLVAFRGLSAFLGLCEFPLTGYLSIITPLLLSFCQHDDAHLRLWCGKCARLLSRNAPLDTFLFHLKESALLDRRFQVLCAFLEGCTVVPDSCVETVMFFVKDLDLKTASESVVACLTSVMMQSKYSASSKLPLVDLKKSLPTDSSRSQLMESEVTGLATTDVVEQIFQLSMELYACSRSEGGQQILDALARWTGKDELSLLLPNIPEISKHTSGAQDQLISPHDPSVKLLTFIFLYKGDLLGQNLVQLMQRMVDRCFFLISKDNLEVIYLVLNSLHLFVASHHHHLQKHFQLTTPDRLASARSLMDVALNSMVWKVGRKAELCRMEASKLLFVLVTACQILSVALLPHLTLANSLSLILSTMSDDATETRRCCLEILSSLFTLHSPLTGNVRVLFTTV